MKRSSPLTRMLSGLACVALLAGCASPPSAHQYVFLDGFLLIEVHDSVDLGGMCAEIGQKFYPRAAMGGNDTVLIEDDEFDGLNASNLPEAAILQFASESDCAGVSVSIETSTHFNGTHRLIRTGLTFEVDRAGTLILADGTKIPTGATYTKENLTTPFGWPLTASVVNHGFKTLDHVVFNYPCLHWVGDWQAPGGKRCVG